VARRPSFADATITRPSQMLPVAQVTKEQPDRVPARRGKKAIAFWVDPGASTQLRVAAATSGRTVQGIMEEALDDWFRKHRLTEAGRGT
jgi:hypothetical protein